MLAKHKYLITALCVILLAGVTFFVYRYFQHKALLQSFAEADKKENQPWFICLKQHADTAPQKTVSAYVYSFYQNELIKSLRSSSLYAITEVIRDSEFNNPSTMTARELLEFSASCEQVIAEQTNQAAIDACWNTLNAQSNPVAINVSGFTVVSSTLENLVTLGLHDRGIYEIEIKECAREISSPVR